MKLKSIRVKKYKLMRLYLAKYEVYKKKGLTSVISDIVLDRLEIGLKKVLFIIYQYHVYNKRILFIGMPQSTDKKFLDVLLKSHHTFVPRFVWKRGLLGNKESLYKKSLNFSYFKNFLNMKNNPHLIIIFNEEKLSNIVLECQKLYIPVIYFGSLKKRVDGLTYLVEGNFVNRKIKNFFQFLIYSILKKQKLELGLLKNTRKKVK
jgi:ribosomal protein S2